MVVGLPAGTIQFPLTIMLDAFVEVKYFLSTP